MKVTAVPQVHKDNVVPIKAKNVPTSTPSGTLDDGTKYVIYRFALYADEFGFNGLCGCYLLLLGASQQNRLSSAGVRVLTLIPKHQDVNKVMITILDDIMKGMVHGFPSTNPAGEKIKVFLDMCVVFGDYVKISAITNTAGHSATCFCTYCRVPKSVSNIGPVYSYSNQTHSRNEAFMRTDEKIDILLHLNLSNKSKQKLGLKTTSSSEAKKLPLVHFSQELINSCRLPYRTTTNTIVPSYFDSSLSTAVAPDHLLSGLIATVLDACFRSLPDNNSRRVIENFILQSAVDNSLPTEGPFLRFNKNSFDGINSMTMSTLYVILLFASYYFHNLTNTKFDTQKLFGVPVSLQNFIAAFYYWPDIDLDCFDDVDFVQTSYPNSEYLERLRDYAFEYTERVASHMRAHGESALLKDRPNSHRLIELAVHTAPLFGHGKLTSELVLELTHTFFKGWFKENTHSSAHLTALDLFTTRIWSSNVFILYHMWKNGTEFEQEMAISNLFRLFFGNKTWELYSAEAVGPSVNELMTEFKSQLDNIMREPIPRMLQGTIPIGFLVESVRWIPKNKLKRRVDDLTTKALRMLSTFRRIAYEELVPAVDVYEKASLTIRGKHNIGIRTYPYKTIYEGTPISFHVRIEDVQKDIVDRLTDGRGVRQLLVVHSIFVYNHKSFIVGFPLKEIGGNCLHRIDKTSVRIIAMEKGISRVAYIYAGIHHTLSNPNSSPQVSSGNQLLHEKDCHIVFRMNGYPPCLG